ncbi:MAG: alpha/beta hydrolase [Phycisphaeraceae bacterium]
MPPTRSRHRTAATLAILLLLAACPGCMSSFLAKKIIDPPHSGRTELPAALDVSTLFDRLAYVRVGPPPADLSVFTIEPKPHLILTARNLRSLEQKASQALPERDQAWTGPTALAVVEAPGGTGYAAVLGPGPRATFATPDPPRGTILLFQGWGGRARESYLIGVAAFFANAGYRVVLPDLRAQGDSTGDWLTFGVLERRDVRQLLTSLESEDLLTPPLVAAGHSYGGLVAIMAAAEDPRIDAIISLSPPRPLLQQATDLRHAAALVSPVYDLLLSWFVSDRELRKAAARAARIADFDPEDTDPARAVTETDAPLLLIHGGADAICIPLASFRIQRARPRGTQLILYEDEDHLSYLYNDRFDELRHDCLTWIDRHFAPPAPASHDELSRKLLPLD